MYVAVVQAVHQELTHVQDPTPTREIHDRTGLLNPYHEAYYNASDRLQNAAKPSKSTVPQIKKKQTQKMQLLNAGHFKPLEIYNGLHGRYFGKVLALW